MRAVGLRTLVKKLLFEKRANPLARYLKGRYYFCKLKREGKTIQDEKEIMKYLIAPGDHVIDVGANYGSYTKWLSEWVGEKGRVFSIEPVPETFQILRRSVLRLHLRNVELFNVAISDREGNVWMTIPAYDDGTRNYYQARILPGVRGPGAQEHIPAKAFSLDGLFAAREEPIAFIKCDVEGHELECVRGAQKVTDRWGPVWYLEVSDDPDAKGSRGYEVLGIFEEKKYIPYWLDGKALRQREEGVQSVNYFFLRPHHLEQMKSSEFLY